MSTEFDFDFRIEIQGQLDVNIFVAYECTVLRCTRVLTKCEWSVRVSRVRVGFGWPNWVT